ncbi:MAG: ROK family protein [Patescibacteria group bacterium]
MKQKIICFDVGGTNLSKAVVKIDSKKKEFEFLEMETVKNPIETKKVEKLFLDYCRDKKVFYKTDLVAISTARPVKRDELMVYNAEGYYGKEFFYFNFLQEEGFKVAIENDGKSFALGEYYFGQSRQAESLLALVVGTGIGCGYVGKNGKVLEGRKGFATEAGHQKFFYNGKWREWEFFCGGKGIENRYYAKTGSRKEAQEIFFSVDTDENSKEIINQAKEFLGIGIANLLTVFDPERVVIGGGISNHREFIEESFQIAQKNLYFKKYVDYSWEFTRLNRQANLLGSSTKHFETF